MSRAKLSLQDESPGETSKVNPELMLQSALWILQMAYLLLQSGPQAQALRPKNELKNLLEEEELCDALDNNDISPGKEVEANEGEERPQDGPQQGIEGPAEELLEWPHHEDMGYADEPLGSGLDNSSLVDEVAEELQHLQLPWEQPQLGLADDRDNMSNKEPLHKCSEDGNDAIKGIAIEATAAKIVEGNKEPSTSAARRTTTLLRGLLRIQSS